jgi:high-affinity nickel permease
MPDYDKLNDFEKFLCLLGSLIRKVFILLFGLLNQIRSSLLHLSGVMNSPISDSDYDKLNDFEKFLYLLGSLIRKVLLLIIGLFNHILGLIFCVLIFAWIKDCLGG